VGKIEPLNKIFKKFVALLYPPGFENPEQSARDDEAQGWKMTNLNFLDISLIKSWRGPLD
jgi:hypothetical protein